VVPAREIFLLVWGFFFQDSSSYLVLCVPGSSCLVGGGFDRFSSQKASSLDEDSSFLRDLAVAWLAVVKVSTFVLRIGFSGGKRVYTPRFSMPLMRNSVRGLRLRVWFVLSIGASIIFPLFD
jgi:hypothetical protein